MSSKDKHRGEEDVWTALKPFFVVVKDQVPKERIKDVMYGCIIVDYRPQRA